MTHAPGEPERTRPFNWAQPLPSPGTTTVLEASAGTGKTFTIAGLVTRFVVEGVPLEKILAVTFSRRATTELRDGIRDRLIRSRTALLRTQQGEPVGGDPVDRVVATGDPGDLLLRQTRIDKALAQLDVAPIMTLHSFAKRMLDELGLLADHDQTTELADDLGLLAEEVIADLFLGEERWQSLGWPHALELGRKAVQHPGEQLYPLGESAAERVGFAMRVRAEFDRRKRLMRVLNYDDMIARLAAALTDPVSGPPAARSLAERFRVVLVDEFQDTDPQQWAFLAAGFHRRSTMVLIGDPKQAIYRFRGGDIETYSAAREAADQLQWLDTNHRSDGDVVRGIEMVFGPVDLGTPLAPIRMTRVNASHVAPRIRSSRPDPAEAVRIRALNTPALACDAARELIRADLLGQINRLLDGGHEVRNPRGDWRKVGPGDLAVLVSSNRVGLEIHTMLASAGHSSVFSGESSVFSTDAATDWLTLLEALETPDRWHVRRAMMTALIGWTSADVAGASGDELVEMTALLTRCARLLTDQGIAAVHETLIAERRLYPRLLGAPGGEAMVSDLRQIAEALNETHSRQRLSPSALTESLRREIERPPRTTEDRARRLPTDRPAIRVLTVHQAKGLQFPIVLLPQAADRHVGDFSEDKPLIGHQDGVRVLDVATPRDRADRADGYAAEEAAESLRSFYVACTRAQSLLVMWWAPTLRNTASSPLHRLLMNTGRRWTSPDPSYPSCPASGLPKPRHVALALVEPDHRPPRQTQPAAIPAVERLLEARAFADHIDREWTRTSYTGLTTPVHGSVPDASGAESDEPEPDDDFGQASLPAELGPTVVEADEPASALAPLPGGTQFGSLVHAVLEMVDPAAADLPDALSAAVAEQSSRFQFPELDTDALVEGLGQTLTTPLGALTDGRTLRDLGAHNRLTELDFELPLGSAAGRSSVADLAELFDIMLAADDPLQRYGRLLANSAAAPTVLAGYLTGSIDVVLQVPGADPRFVVLDYKTNRMATRPDQPLVARCYSPAAMTRAMCEAHYPLQALLYCVALHRHLEWRLPGYRPQTHLGGVGYLFVRGMTGPGNLVIEQMPTGVFTWLPPAQMIVRASSILGGGV